MFIRVAEHLQKTAHLSAPKKGIVLENADPLQLGRVQCSVEGLFPVDATLAQLPWIAPKSRALFGGSSEFGEFHVPEIGSELNIEFPTEDIYFPVYTSYYHSSVTHPGEMDADYPDTYGWRDSTGTRLKINKALQILEFIHTLGWDFVSDEEGNVVLHLPGTLQILDMNEQSGVQIDPATGAVTAIGQGGQSISGDLKVDNSIVDIQTDSMVESVTGSRDSTYGGGRVERIGGSRASAVISSDNLVAGGGQGTTIGGPASHTYGAGLTVVIATANYGLQALLGNVVIRSLLATLTLSAGGIADLSGILVTINGGFEPMLKGQSTVSWLQSHTHPTGMGPSGPPNEAAQAAQLMSLKSFVS
jgi:hypothetical protein